MHTDAYIIDDKLVQRARELSGIRKKAALVREGLAPLIAPLAVHNPFAEAAELGVGLR